MAAPVPFRVRYGDGPFLPVLLPAGASEQGIEKVVAATVGLLVGTFVIENADGVKSPFHAGLEGDWDVVLLPVAAPALLGVTAPAPLAAVAAAVPVRPTMLLPLKVAYWVVAPVP